MRRKNTMRLENVLLVAVTLSVVAAPAMLAADMKLIANPSVKAPSVSAEELKSVFLITKTSLRDGTHVEPVLEKGGPVHVAFVKEYLGKTDSALQTYYRSLVFSGKGLMPKACGTDAEVVAC